MKIGLWAARKIFSRSQRRVGWGQPRAPPGSSCAGRKGEPGGAAVPGGNGGEVGSSASWEVVSGGLELRAPRLLPMVTDVDRQMGLG